MVTVSRERVDQNARCAFVDELRGSYRTLSKPHIWRRSASAARLDVALELKFLAKITFPNLWVGCKCLG